MILWRKKKEAAVLLLLPTVWVGGPGGGKRIYTGDTRIIGIQFQDQGLMTPLLGRALGKELRDWQPTPDSSSPVPHTRTLTHTRIHIILHVWGGLITSWDLGSWVWPGWDGPWASKPPPSTLSVFLSLFLSVFLPPLFEEPFTGLSVFYSMSLMFCIQKRKMVKDNSGVWIKKADMERLNDPARLNAPLYSHFVLSSFSPWLSSSPQWPLSLSLSLFLSPPPQPLSLWILMQGCVGMMGNVNWRNPLSLLLPAVWAVALQSWLFALPSWGSAWRCRAEDKGKG